MQIRYLVHSITVLLVGWIGLSTAGLPELRAAGAEQRAVSHRGNKEVVYYGTQFEIVTGGNWYWRSGKDNSLATACEPGWTHQNMPPKKSWHKSVAGKFCTIGLNRYPVEEIHWID
jgi:hypothetical protein